ncbi:hypothetical protein [Rhodopseudomonas palustris]|uniref:Uncharacterized protein n=1 Tax=Rhodopseudomonas palustris (strain ATCC BAA-98 / CGA009) TaxID=258594 RepID=Q6N1P4_RHOPA|nr:hypothetical protein [Rhodopseudomonas palustris]OPF92253.1 hypothetical protein B1S06_13770 [Rhodopseudomonas palustris]PPQ41762.1 hypothetical protein CKO39_20570 [Rhodopseudomonas palustris]QLH73300.1 hypothetical protein HZF03_21825 [Rhodopseudomonas palustris]QQM05926.1 hypothetical protein I8G32_04497 [Rhodopseudomonas palustris]RHZ99588.1 hypothetical protein D1920_15365 [Rhodopseudomonas palustris]
MLARLPRQIATRTMRTALLLTLLTGLAGCVTGGGPGAGPMASAGGSGVAFESIDGPPPQVFDRMVAVLDSESKLRNIPVVSREGGAAYRVRSYLSAQVRGNRTNIAWVWDVYDRNQQRTLRLSGEEPAGNGRDAWQQADDVVLRRIAQAGLTGMSGLVNGGLPADTAPAAAPSERGPAIASAEPAPAASSDAPSAALSFAAR